MEVITGYWDFINRDVDPNPMRGIDAQPNFIKYTAAVCLAFCLLFVLVPLITKGLWGEGYKNLEARKQIEYPSYVVCLVHHFMLVPLAWYSIYNDLYRLDSRTADYASIEAIRAPICIGYLFADTIFYAFPELLRGKVDYMIHHVLSLFLVVYTLYCPDGSIMRYIPFLLICDTTNIFFNVAWLLRLSPNMRGSFIVTTLELLFAVSFLFIRAIHMPLMFFSLVTKHGATIGLAKYVIVPIGGLQWYWLVKIIQGVTGRVGDKKGKGGKDL